jgi:hypothetical protein
MRRRKTKKDKVPSVRFKPIGGLGVLIELLCELTPGGWFYLG